MTTAKQNQTAKAKMHLGDGRISGCPVVNVQNKKDTSTKINFKVIIIDTF